MPRMTSAKRLEKVRSLRDGAVALVQEAGVWIEAFMPDGSAMKLLGAERGAVRVTYHTPFQKLPSVTDEHRYMRAVYGGKDNLPYGLNIWHAGKKVLNVEWDDAGNVEILGFRPGDWEAELSATMATTN